MNDQAIKAIEAIKELTMTISGYYQSLIMQGIDKSDALKLTIAYQDSMIKSSTMAEVEREKNMLLHKFGGQNQ